MLATELLFVYIYCLVDDAIKAGALLIPRRPGPAPACTDAELLTIALVRHLLGRRSENGFLAEIRRDWPHLFPRLPDQPEVNRRTRWLWGAFEQLRAAWAATVPADPRRRYERRYVRIHRETGAADLRRRSLRDRGRDRAEHLRLSRGRRCVRPRYGRGVPARSRLYRADGRAGAV